MRCRAPAAALLLLIATLPAAATLVTRFTLEEVVVAGDRVAFFASGLVVLDASTGSIVARDRRIRSARLIETSRGILVAPWQGEWLARTRFYSPDGNPAWNVACDLWHAGTDHVVCVNPWSSPRNLVVEIRSLADGQMRWSWATGGSGGEALDAGNRLMIVNQDQVYEEHSYQASYGPVTSAGYFPRAIRLTVLDLATGQVSGATDLPNLSLYGSHGSTPPNYEFDGDRVLIRTRGAPGCAIIAVSYTLDAARARFDVGRACEPVVQPPPQSQRAWTRVEERLAPAVHRLDEGELVSFSGIQAGTLFERRSPRAERWQVVLPWRQVDGWRFGGAWQRGGTIFIEGNAWSFGTLDAVDLESGRPRWRYVFPASSALASVGVFGMPPGVGRFSAAAWRARLQDPPPPLIGLAAPLPLERFANRQEDPLANQRLHEPAPTAFDPVAEAPPGEVVADAVAAWWPAAGLAGVLIAGVRLWRRVRGRRISPGSPPPSAARRHSPGPSSPGRSTARSSPSSRS